jgi:sterol desaturase/sphingolipid hydroxylase (fatty acid hydroxylase superfamily)
MDTAWADVVAWHARAPLTAYAAGVWAAHIVGVLGTIAVAEALHAWLAPGRRQRPSPAEAPHWWAWVAGTEATAAALSAASGGLLAACVKLEDGGVPPSLLAWVAQLVALALIADAGLYAAHRLLHGVPALWAAVHSVHHRVRAPTALAVMYIHPVDTLLQQALPMLAAAALVRPHLAAFYAWSAAHLAETVLNHAGLMATTAGSRGVGSSGGKGQAVARADDEGRGLALAQRALSLLFFRWLPGRADASHHDDHHRWSGHGGRTRNLGEAWWLWDAACGTLAAAAHTAKEGRAVVEGTAE